MGPELATYGGRKKKPSDKIKSVSIDALDDGTYTISGYSEASGSKKFSARTPKDLIAKAMEMMGKKAALKDVAGEENS